MPSIRIAGSINKFKSSKSQYMTTNFSIKKLSKHLAILSVAIISIVSILMIVNYLQIKMHHPIASDTVDTLIRKLDTSANDQELREQIRAVDLLARKAYFSSVWQLKTGAWILLGFGILFILSIRIYTKKETIESALNLKQEDFWTARTKERKWLFISIGSLSIVALLLSFGSNKYYTDFIAMGLTVKTEGVEPGSKIEQTVASEIIGQDSVLTTDSVIAPDFPSDAEVKQNHPGFRGPFGLGVNYKLNIPTDWDGLTNKNIIWKKEIALPGLNSPVLWGNMLFLAGANATSRVVYCYNRLTGKLIWTKEVKNIPGSPSNSPKVSNDAGYAASSLTTDGKRVYAIFATGDLICLDYKGEEVWAKNLGVPENHYGYSSSLQFYKDKLIIQYDDNKSCKLIALSTQTGDEIWNTRRDGKISWSSPIIVPKANGSEIILNNLPYVASFDAETGKLKWKNDCLMGEIGSSPAYGNGIVFAANEYAKMVAIRDGKTIWESFDYLPDVSSPVAYKDFVFFTTSYGDMVCINQKDGAVIWKHEFDNGFYGSPVVADGKLYNIDRSGITVIVEAGREFKLIGQPALGEKSDCTPAFADGRIYIRGQKYLFCIGNN